MLDDLYQEGTDKVLADRATRPLPQRTESPGFGQGLWNTAKAPVKGVVAGANESAAFASDILGAFGSIQAGIGLQADPTNLFDPEGQKQRIQAGEQARAQLDSGEAFSTDLGDGLRARSRSLMPDAATANAAEEILFGLGRFMSKAVGYSMVAGPVPGAVMTGADEGMTEADKLKAQGVDFTTRTKVGMVAGASAGAAVALPVAGTTVAGTAALVAAGGPASFIAQQAASRSILEHAGYDKIGQQYDPFDPVGLALSTLVPAGFGAWAMRGVKAQPKPAIDPAAARALADMGANERQALKYDDPRLDAYAVTAAQRAGIPPEALLAIKNTGERSAPTAVSPKGAHGVMQFMPDTWAAFGKGDPRDPVASIDAGAAYMKSLIDQYGGDVRAAIAHYNGGGKAGAAVRAGKDAPAAETRNYLQRVDDYLAQRAGTEAGKAMAGDPEAVAAARVAQVRQAVDAANPMSAGDARAADDHLAAMTRAADQLAAGERVDVAGMIDEASLDHAKLDRSIHDVLFDEPPVAPGFVRLYHGGLDMPSVTGRYVAPGDLRYARGYAAKSGEDGRVFYTDIPETDPRLVKTFDDTGTSVKAPYSPFELRDGEATGMKMLKPRQQAATAQAKPVAQPAKKADANGAQKPTGQENLAATALDAQSAEIARLSPDMMVQFEGMEKPMRLADALEAVKAEAAKDVADAPLLEVAANCFLSA